MSNPRSSPPIVIALGGAVLALSWHVWFVTRAWHVPGMSGHVFRQTQTAVTVQAMKSEGFRLDYSTPIMGKPWSIPFEFPVYEFLAATVSNQAGLGEVAAGRWVSLAAFYLTLPGCLLLMRRAGFSTSGSILAVVPLLFAPVYVLYSRAVLIETTALCAAVWFFALLVLYRERRTPWRLTLTLVVGILAVLIKSTTWAVVCVPWFGLLAADIWRARRQRWAAFRVVVDDVVLIALPLLGVGCGWVWVTDEIKRMNPMGSFLTSDRLLSFNFGTLSQRGDSGVWQGLWTHWQAAVMPWWAFAVAALALVWAGRVSRMVWGLGLGAFGLVQLLFINLYWHHDYYFCAIAVGACVGVGAVVAGIWDGAKRPWLQRAAALALLAFVCAGEAVAYFGNFHRVQLAAVAGSTPLTDAIKRLTQAGEVLVMQSPLWSAETAFWSERRMLAVPDSQMFFQPDAVRQAIGMLSGESVPLLIVRGESRDHGAWLVDRIGDLDLRPVPLLTCGDDVVYASRDRYRQMRAILAAGPTPGITLYDGRDAEELSPCVAIAGTPAGSGMTMLSPTPLRASMPYGVQYYGLDGRSQLLIHSPTELEFAIPPGATKVEFGYRMAPAALAHQEFDGVELRLEIRELDGRAARLYRTNLSPDRARALQCVSIPLRPRAGGTLVFSSLPGPRNSSAFDWALLEYLRIK